MMDKYFVGFDKGWFIQCTEAYKRNAFGEFITSKGTFSGCFDTEEQAQRYIHDSDKGYVKIEIEG